MRNIKITVALIALLGLSSSCEDFLSEIPDNRTQLNTPDKISEILVNAYPGGSYMEFLETMTDNVGESQNLSGTTIKNSQNYFWQMAEKIDQDTPAYYWDACYTAISHANQAIEAIDKLGRPANLNPQLGEALIARAYSHFMLASVFGQRYNPATAATDLGIPYLLEPETVLLKTYKRNTMAEVYDLLEKDIVEGLKHVGSDYTQVKFHFNKAAAKAFASRFYLVKGDWDKVLLYSDDLSIQPIGKLRDLVKNNALNTTAQFRIYADASETTNLLISSPYSTYNRTIRSNRFALTGADRDVFFGSATNLFNKSWLYGSFSSNGSISIFLPKTSEYFKITNANAGIGQPYVANVLLGNEELFFNKIEAHIMKSEFDLANTEIQYFLSTRTTGYNATTDVVTQAKIVAKYPVIADEYTPFYTLTPVQTSYIKAVAELRRIEFIHEGLRWFDIKRFNYVVTHKVYNEPSRILKKNDLRRAIQIPLHATNTGIEKNPI
ncbi:RagB/SusD family nutrient uptake outer membrane protein [Flavobacterium faecale]|uniref:RagB/SusD family nutrient uptake outer membrane protein n=1 Tax=Flavobacterium faecale TaxID=1355330 RepID=A0A2S1LDF0_9FLAO|nr:RagB/SusD family nutrient uptake outer membrane protein [Flavobacterium faecale]AWG21780.1 RagB/SusD family nutrient uptake outer membrane protein [Flavobacterium faecale]